MEANIRTFKDFLQIYNILSHTCFKRCVDNLNYRNLDHDEIKCVDDCSEKFIKLNHRLMAIYVQHQQVLLHNRLKENEATALASEQEKSQLELNNPSSVPITSQDTVLTPQLPNS